MDDRFSRTQLIYGKENMEKLKNARVCIFGIGGVGGHAAEALARSGVGTIDVVDSDKVAYSNLNRQIIATEDTVGKYKVDAMEDRIKSISPDTAVNKFCLFYLPETRDKIDFKNYDYIIDAVDTVSAKIDIIMRANEEKIPVISSMGAGNKTNPSAFEVSDIYKTSVCPLARVMRLELKKRGIKKLKVVYSKEKPITPDAETEEELLLNEENSKRRIPGSNAFVPAVAGLIIAAEVVNDITGFNGERD